MAKHRAGLDAAPDVDPRRAVDLHGRVHLSRPERSGYRPDVQGLRAIAVTLVVVYHLYPGRLSGGYIGVDVFFVISGYLITGLLLRSTLHGARRDGRPGGVARVGLLEFYARRARRLLPAAVLVLTVTWFAARAFLPVTELQDTASQIRASALYVQNWVLAHNSVNYLKADAAPTPVQHFWSLSVEEQFYLVWPLILVIAVAVAIWVSRREPGAYPQRVLRAVAFALAAGIVVASLVYSLHETASNPAAAYFQTTTRMWELGFGGLLALLPRQVSERVGRVGLLAWAGLAMIVAAAVIDNARTPFPGSAALVPVIGAGLMLVCGSSAARLGTARLTSLRPAVSIGDLSYSIYLWHWPMIVIWTAYNGGSRPAIDGVGIAVAAVLASWLSTKYVENPIRNGTFVTRSNVRGLAVASLAILPVALATAFLGAQPAPHPNRIDATHAGAQIIAQTPAPVHDVRQPSVHSPESAALLRPEAIQWLPASAAHTALSPTSSKIIPSLTAVSGDYGRGSSPACKDTDFQTRVKTCTFGDTTNPTLTVALVGDSHAAQWATALATIATQQHWKLVEYIHDSCTFGSATLVLQNQTHPFTWCHVWAQQTLAALIKLKPDVAIVTARVSAGTVQHWTGDATSFAQIGRGEVDYWRKLIAAHIGVVAIHETPEPGKDIPGCLAARGATVDGCATSTRTALTRHTPIDAASKIIGSAVPVINMNGYMCTVSVCPAVVGDVIVYRDKHHLTDTYADSLIPFLRDRLLSIPALAAASTS